MEPSTRGSGAWVERMAWGKSNTATATPSPGNGLTAVPTVLESTASRRLGIVKQLKRMYTYT